MRLVFIGPGCNNCCVFCPQGTMRSNVPDPADDEVLRRLDLELASPDFDGAIAFVGGEPTLHPSLADWVSMAKRRGALRAIVQTNGRPLSQGALARRLARSGLDGAEVSLHGSTAAMHDYHTGVPGSFEQTLAGARAARKAGLEVGLKTVVTRSNFRNLTEIVRLARSLGADGFRLEAARPFGRASDRWEQVVPNEEVVKSRLDEASTLARSLGLLGPACAGLFAGLGPVEAPSEPLPSSEASLPAGRRKPAPGAREARSAVRKTGEALREIFPGLFEKGGEG